MAQAAPQGTPAPDAPEPADLPAGGRASADAIEPIVTEADDGTPFDVEAARARALKLQHGDDGEDKPEEAKKPPEPKAEPESVGDGDEEESKKARAELMDKDGKLDNDKLERAFASLTKQEKRLRKREGELRDGRKGFELQQAQHKESLAALEQEREQFRTRRERAKKNPLSALEELGWTYEQVVKYVVDDGKVPPEKLVRDIEEATKTRLDELKREKDELQADVEKHRTIQAGTDYERRLRANVAELHSAYKYVSKWPVSEVQDAVLQIQVQHYEENARNPQGKQKTIDSKEILDILENRQAEIVNRLGLESGQAGAATQKPEAGKSKPLTNDATAVRASVPKHDDEDTPFDRDAALKEAIRMTG